MRIGNQSHLHLRCTVVKVADEALVLSLGLLDQISSDLRYDAQKTV